MTSHLHRMIALVLALIMVVTAVPAMTASADAVSGTSVEIKVSDGSVDARVKLMNADTLVALIGSIIMNDQPLSLGVYVGELDFIVDFPDLLGRAYGMNRHTFKEKLPQSVFAPDSGSAFALPKEIYDQVMSSQSTLGAYNAQKLDMDLLAALGEKAVAYVEPFGKMLMDNAYISVTPDTIGNRKVSRTTVTVDAETMAEASAVLLEQIKNDPEMKDLMAQAVDMLVEAGVLHLPEELGNQVGATLMNSLWGQLDSLSEQVGQAYRDQQLMYSVTVALDKQTQEPLGAGVTYFVSGELLSLYGELEENAICLTLTVNDQISTLRLALEETTDNSVAVSAKAAVNGEEVFAAVVRIAAQDDQHATMDVSITSDGETHTVGFTGVNEGDVTTIRLATVDGEPFPYEVAVIVNKADTVTVPEYTDILTMAESEMAELIQRIGALVGSLSQSPNAA